MAWRYRKSFKILPGVRVNLNKKSRSITIGGKFARTTFSNTGRVTNSVSVPGTGLYHTSTVRKNANKKTANPPVVHSPRTYRVCGVILEIISILLFAMALAMLSFTAWGLVFALFAVLLFLAGKKYRKFAKEPTLAEQDSEEEA